MFGDLRAQRIAFTEPTRAAAQQTFAIQNQALQAGINTTMVWIAENDGTTCDICLPLDRLLQDQWPPEVSAGPPAHVNCRCAIGLQLVKSPIVEPEAGTIDVVADPNATPPPVPLLQRSAADIADYIISEVPAIAKAEYDTLQQLKSEADALYIQFNTSPDLATRITAGQQYNAKLKEIDKQQKAYHKAEAKTFDAVLPQLQSATPQQVTLQFNATFTAAQQAEIRKYVELTAGMSKQQTNGNPIVIYVEPNKDRNAYGTYDFATQTLSINKSSPTRTIVHETLHAMQHQLKYGVAETDSYGDSRTSGKAITQPNGYPVYTGITDNDYAYRVYTPFIQNNVGKWCEILTTTIHNIAGWDRVQDRSIIELATQIIKDNN